MDYVSVPYQNQVKEYVLLDVHDGDTLTIGLELTEMKLKLKVRLSGIDTPEISRSKTAKNSSDLAGRLVRDHVRSLLLSHSESSLYLFNDSRVTCQLLSLDKYGGRYVGDVYLRSGEKLTDYLIARKLGKPYQGAAKQQWTEQEIQHIIEQLNH